MKNNQFSFIECREFFTRQIGGMAGRVVRIKEPLKQSHACHSADVDPKKGEPE